MLVPAAGTDTMSDLAFVTAADRHGAVVPVDHPHLNRTGAGGQQGQMSF